MPYTSSSPDHPDHRHPDHPNPDHRRQLPLTVAFERMLRDDRRLGGLAARHGTHRSLRVTFLAVLGPPAVWLLSGRTLPAAIAAIGFTALLGIGCWAGTTQGWPQTAGLLTAIRWIAVAMVAMGLLVAWNSPADRSLPDPGPGSGLPVISVNGPRSGTGTAPVAGLPVSTSRP